MQPHLYLNRGKKRVLLVRYFDMLHFVTLDHRMHQQNREWFLAQPRTVEEMNRKQLSRSSVDIQDIRGIAVGGLGRGQLVQLYLKDGKRRYELYEDCDQDTLSILFRGLVSFTPPKQKNSWQDWRLAQQEPGLRKKLWILGGAVNVAGVGAGWFTMYSGYRFPWINWLCLLCLVGAFVLYFRYPAYFAIAEPRRRYGQRRSAFGLYPVLMITPLMMGAAALAQFHVFFWWKAWAIGGMIVVVLSVLLWKLSPEFRDPGEYIAFLLVATLISFGPVITVNCLLDRSPDREIRAEVVDTDLSSGKGGDHYYLHVEVDGYEAKLPVPEKLYVENPVGSRVTVDCYRGALGIPYAEIE